MSVSVRVTSMQKGQVERPTTTILGKGRGFRMEDEASEQSEGAPRGARQSVLLSRHNYKQNTGWWHTGHSIECRQSAGNQSLIAFLCDFCSRILNDYTPNVL